MIDSPLLAVHVRTIPVIRFIFCPVNTSAEADRSVLSKSNEAHSQITADKNCGYGLYKSPSNESEAEKRNTREKAIVYKRKCG